MITTYTYTYYIIYRLPILLSEMNKKMAIREIPKGVQYLGYSPHVSTGLMVLLYDAIFNLDLSSVSFSSSSSNSNNSSSSSNRNTFSASISAASIASASTSAAAIASAVTTVTHDDIASKQAASPGNISRRIKLCIMSEHDGNSSPAIFLMDVIMDWVHLHSAHFEVIYFCRLNSILKLSGDFIRADESLGHKVIFIDHFDIFGSAESIVLADCDILFYLALPTELFSTILSFGKLARTTVQFGIGHPITSGSSSVDYSVVSKLFFDSRTSLLRSGERFVESIANDDNNTDNDNADNNADNNADDNADDTVYSSSFYSRVLKCSKLVGDMYAKCHGMHPDSNHEISLCLQNSCPKFCFHSLAHYSDSDIDILYTNSSDTFENRDNSGWMRCDTYHNLHLSEAYSEQLVVFDTLGYYMSDSLELIADKFDPLQAAYIRSCGYLDHKFSEWKLKTSIPITSFGCFAFSDDTQETRNSVNSADIMRLNTSMETTTVENSEVVNTTNSIYFKKKVHVYSIIQHLNKWHPKFDHLIISLLMSDDLAVFLVPDRAMEHVVPRLWGILKPLAAAAQVSASSDAMASNISYSYESFISRFLFVPRLDHHKYLFLMSSIADVFLITSPFSTGVTSSDAISLGIPVVVLKNSCQGIDIALGQTSMLDAPRGKGGIAEVNNGKERGEEEEDDVDIEYNDHSCSDLSSSPYPTLLDSLHAKSIADLAQKAIFWAERSLGEIDLYDMNKAAASLTSDPSNHNGAFTDSIYNYYRNETSCLPLFSRQMLMKRKYRIFSENSKKKITKEWVNFFEKIFIGQNEVIE